MARPKTKRPKYQYHESGQAFVEFNGVRFYLGEYETRKSIAKYHRLVTEYLENGLQTPDSDPHLADDPVRISDLTAEYQEYVRTIHHGKSEPIRSADKLCELLCKHHGKEPADEFGPRKLAAIRLLFIDTGNKRNTVNRKIREVVRIFKFGVSMELVEPATWQKLTALESLKANQSAAPESEPVAPVSMADITATTRHLSPVIRAMIELHVLTGMRPSEVFRMRPCDIEKRPDGVWVYRPFISKNERHGHDRRIPIVGDNRIALEPYLDRDPESFCFSPAESAEWYVEQKQRVAKCPRKKPYKGKTTPQRRPGEQFDKDSYRKAIQRACVKAGVERWVPLQLRHTSATLVREALNIEAAQHLLGHRSPSMTVRYAECSLERGVEAAHALQGNR
ncbi:site-specific integrase [Rhodopirellula sp.]|nr:site-specific integrase [Rhodopirellula sp.]